MYTKSQDLSLIEAVRNAVFEAGPDPTVPLTEQRLAERFGRSRTPVRDVLRELEHDGIIERRQRRGIRLRRPLAHPAGGRGAACPRASIGRRGGEVPALKRFHDSPPVAKHAGAYGFQPCPPPSCVYDSQDI